MSDAWTRTAALSLSGCVPLLPLLVLPVMVGGFVDHLGLGEDQAGWLASAGFLGAALAALLLAFRMHRLDLRRLALLGLLLMAVTDGLSAFAGQWDWKVLASLRLLSGLGSGMAYGAVMGSFACWREPDRAYGFFMAVQFGVSAAGLYLLPAWLPGIGISGLFLGFAALDLLALAFVAQLAGGPERARYLAAGRIEWQLVLSLTALACLLGLGLFETANMAQFTYIERIGVMHGLAAGQIGLALGFSSLIGVPAAFSVTLIGSRFGYYRPLLFAASLQITSLFLLLSPVGARFYVPAVILMSAGWAMSLPYFQAILARMDRGGSVVVAGGFATGAGGFLGPAGAAALVGPGSYSLMLYAVIICLLLANVLARLVTLRLRA